MPPSDEIRRFIADNQLRLQLDRAHLRKLAGGLAETQTVIERATIAYMASDRLLRKVHGFGLAAADLKTTAVDELPPPHSIRCPRCRSTMVWYSADLANDRRAL